MLRVSPRLFGRSDKMMTSLWYLLLVSCVEAKILVNLARGKSAEQSSTEENAVASLAIDGHFSLDGNSCSMTESEENPQWILDLGREYTVYRIKITGNPDGFLGLSVSVKNKCYFEDVHDPRDGVVDVVWPEGDRGRYVYIENKVTRPYVCSLTLCEVQVYGKQEQHYQMDSKRVSAPELSRLRARSSIECAVGCLYDVYCISFLWNPSTTECVLYYDPPTVTSSPDNQEGYVAV